MKPLFLRLKAFGPFAATVQVSFDRVFDGGLFLIHGRTGSGKTSLLDGLCFSLFGKPSSEEREKDMRALRSDLASAQTMTETEFVFAIGLSAYRILRIPTQLIPKKRGDGETLHQASAEISQFEGTLAELRVLIDEAADLASLDFASGRWKPLAGKEKAVNEFVEKLLGMNESQFRQVVVLPQGRFREFLSSSSTERQAILEKLFQTDRFSKLQSYIATRATQDKLRFSAASDAIDVKLKQFGLSKFEDVAPRKLELRSKLDASIEGRTVARAQVEHLAAELARAEDYERGQIRFASLTAEANSLSAQSPQIEASRLRLSEARKWNPFFQLEAQHEIAIRKTSERQQLRKTSLSTLASLNDVHQTIVKKYGVLKAKKPSLEEILAERSRLREIAVALKDIEATRKKIEAERSQDASVQADFERLKVEAEQIEIQQSNTVGRLFSIDETLQAREAIELETADRAVREIELKFHRAEASRLAASLKTNEPCPVCGSTVHPEPARVDSSVAATAADVKMVRVEFEQRQLRTLALREKRKSRLEPLLTNSRSLVDRAQLDDLDFETNFQRFESNRMRLSEIRLSLETRSAASLIREESRREISRGLDEKLNVLPLGDRSLENVMKRGLELKAEFEAREPELKNLETAIANASSELARVQGAVATLSDEIARLEVENIERQRKLDDLKPDGARPHAPAEPNQILKLEADIESFNEKTTRNAALLQDVRDLLTRIKSTRPSIDLADELRHVSLRRDELEQTVAADQVHFDGLSKLEIEFTSALEHLSLLKKQAERGARMAALLTGDRSQNKMLVPLSRFVLQSRFDEVLEQANRRLGRMSRGQFQLRRPALSRNLRDSQGLELSVEDSIAGKERHAGSLSGGESFMAALSLALGLADVVQADLGGIKLDSVLIDEGFGTLDSEALDLAMRTLVDLQDGGRVVGIISHVQELKAQVHDQLEVSKTPRGSRLEWRV